MKLDMESRRALGANAFYKTGAKEYLGIINNPNGGAEEAMAAIPAIVNLSFSIELFLKSLKPDLRGHKIKELFDSQDDDTKIVIKRLVVSACNEVDSNYDENDFVDDVVKMSDSFVEWRYFFEASRNARILFIYNFASILHGLFEIQTKGIDALK
ncbi:hypothetical protein [Enterocloster clostridioformis]|uniref:hypothetical protein n=1 Tax=Enterocloster clostridioformis TaxID=1531 RepID=UPI0004078CAC|nr:hypothetical protein [Enterocloster clostridioformis]